MFSVYIEIFCLKSFDLVQLVVFYKILDKFAKFVRTSLNRFITIFTSIQRYGSNIIIKMRWRESAVLGLEFLCLIRKIMELVLNRSFSLKCKYYHQNGIHCSMQEENLKKILDIFANTQRYGSNVIFTSKQIWSIQFKVPISHDVYKGIRFVPKFSAKIEILSYNWNTFDLLDDKTQNFGRKLNPMIDLKAFYFLDNDF